MTSANGKNVGHILIDFMHEFGAPAHLTYDGTVVQVGKGTTFQKTLQKADIKRMFFTPRRPNENPAEATIHRLKLRFIELQKKGLIEF